MSIDSAVRAATVSEELVEITSGGKTYLVSKALADEVLRRRKARAVRQTRASAPGPTKPSKRKRRRRRGFSGSTRSRASGRTHFRPGRGRVRLIG